MSQRRKRNSSRANLIISVIFHSLLVVGIFFLAAREGMLGKKLKELTIITPPKEVKKEPEQAKQKPAEQPKPDEPKPVKTAKLMAPPPSSQSGPPPVADSSPTAAPAAVSLPAFSFNDGAKDTVSVSDPKLVYKGLVELALRSHWNRPEDIDDATFVAEVEVNIDSQGKVTGTRFTKLTGNTRWDNSVKAAVAATKVVTRPPPKGFPGTFVVRFDVQTEQTENAMQLSSR